MKKTIIRFAIFLSFVASVTGCKKYLDINSDPDTPQNPDASSVFPAMLAAIPRGTQYDARYVSKYIQNFAQSTSANVWDMHFYQSGSDNGGDIWRQCYYGLGANLNYIINEGQKKGQWDYVGAALALKALMFQMCTDEYGEIIYTEAFKENTAIFKYDDQPTVYKGVDSLCRLAVYYLSRTDLSTSNSSLAKGDFVYDGNTAKWTKFAYGILARNFHRTTNKSSYLSNKVADSVIKYAGLAMGSINDDFLVPFDASKNDDSNFFGPYRDNLSTFRQTKLIVSLLDGSTLAGVTNATTIDPRIKHMLGTSNDLTSANGGYRGVDANLGETNSGNTRAACPFGDSLYANPSAARFDPSKGKFLFRDKVVTPIMTYSEMQFLIAEASFLKSDPTAAYTAYRNGIAAHFDFINRSTFPRSNVPLYNFTPITTVERNNYGLSLSVKQNAALLTKTDIMLQKYIALWGWGFFETWVDMRRYHYTDIDAATGFPVYKGYIVPTLNAANGGKLATRIRPRYNSEYVWNVAELTRIGALATDYHTKEMWFSLP